MKKFDQRMWNVERKKDLLNVDKYDITVFVLVVYGMTKLLRNSADVKDSSENKLQPYTIYKKKKD